MLQLGGDNAPPPTVGRSILGTSHTMILFEMIEQLLQRHAPRAVQTYSSLASPTLRGRTLIPKEKPQTAFLNLEKGANQNLLRRGRRERPALLSSFQPFARLPPKHRRGKARDCAPYTKLPFSASFVKSCEDVTSLSFSQGIPEDLVFPEVHRRPQNRNLIQGQGTDLPTFSQP